MINGCVREFVVVVVHVECDGDADLAEIIQTGGLVGALLALTEGGQQHGRKNSYDGNNH